MTSKPTKEWLTQRDDLKLKIQKRFEENKTKKLAQTDNRFAESDTSIQPRYDEVFYQGLEILNNDFNLPELPTEAILTWGNFKMRNKKWKFIKQEVTNILSESLIVEHFKNQTIPNNDLRSYIYDKLNKTQTIVVTFSQRQYKIKIVRPEKKKNFLMVAIRVKRYRYQPIGFPPEADKFWNWKWFHNFRENIFGTDLENENEIIMRSICKVIAETIEEGRH